MEIRNNMERHLNYLYVSTHYTPIPSNVDNSESKALGVCYSGADDLRQYIRELLKLV